MTIISARTLGLAVGLAAAALLGPAVASAQSAGHTMPGMTHGTMPGMAGPDSGSAAADGYQSAMTRMHTDMMVKPTGNPDVDFVRGMIPHHQGAIDMAKVELQYGTDPEVKRLAQAVVDAQEKEIAWMRDWLAKHPPAK